MQALLQDLTREIRRTLGLAHRFGGGQLPAVTALSAAQGIAQMAAAGAMMPFLTLATSRATDLPSNQFGPLSSWEPGTAILAMGGLALFLQVLAGALGMAGDYGRSRFAHLTAQRLSAEMMSRVAAQPYLAHLNANSALQIKRLRDDVHVFLTEVLLPLMDAIVRAATAILLIAVLFFINPLATLLMGLVFGGLYALVLFRLRGFLLRANRQRADLVRRQFHTASELLTNMKLLIVYGAREHFVERYASATRALAENEIPVSVLRVAPRMILEMLAFAALIFVVLATFNHPDQAAQWIPLTGTFAMAGYRLLPSVSLVYSQMVSFLTRRAVVDEILQTLESTPPAAFPPSPVSGRLPFARQVELRIPGFSYPGQSVPALSRLHLTIAKGSHTGITGPSGSGKSTLLDLLLGLHQAESGGLFLDDQPIHAGNLEAWRALIGYVPQDVQLLDATIRENIVFGRPLDETLLHQVIAVAQLTRLIQDDLAHGLETLTGERGLQLSGGQRQRIALARALYREPEILIFDEATSALDQTTERVLLEALRDWRPELTVISVAHRPAAIRHCTVVHLLERGQIVASGSLADLELRLLVPSSDAA